jgi:hypothetical protein
VADIARGSSDGVDIADLNPAFAPRLAAFRAGLAQAGIQTNIVSGYRSPELQARLYANYQAKQQGRPLPYPQENNGGIAASPWRSFHNYGLAADVMPANPADYKRMWAMASQYGLTALGPKDIDHFQLAGNLPDLIGQYRLANWRPDSQPAPTQGAIAYAGPAGGAPTAVASNAPIAPAGTVASAAPAASGGSGGYLSQRDQHIQFIRDYAKKIGVNPDLALGIAQAEGLNAWSAKNPAAGSYIDRDAQGRPFSFGDFQLNTNRGLGVTARSQGIDPSDPNQWQAADRFALDQMKAGGVGPWRGDPVAKAYLASGKVAPFTAGSTLNTTGGPAVGSQTGDASGGAGTGASGVAATPGTASTSQPAGGLAASLPGFAPDSPGAKMTATGLKTLTGDQGGGGGGGGGSQPSMPPLPMPQPPMAAGGPMMMLGGQNTMGQRAAEQALGQRFMTQPTLAANAINPTVSPIGALPPGGMAAGQASGFPGMPGTTLNSPSQLQMALMTGNINPYDVYANAGFGGVGS